MKVGIVGVGLQFQRRAPALKPSGDELVAVASLHFEHASEVARQSGCRAVKHWSEIVSMPDVEAVMICTPPHVHAEIGVAALKAGKHVLCEKPLTRTIKEAAELLEAAKSSGKVLKCGFNHRHHPAVWEAHRRLSAGEIGTPLFARCRYGICGRPGYEKEWRADPAQVPGGQFIEQGTHALDLFRWFLGEPAEAACMTSLQYFTQQKLEESGMAVYRMKSGATASLHTTLTNWKNLFSFEVFGTEGYLVVEGLGASYGVETLTIGRRDFNAPFQNHVIEYRGGDISWREEWKEFTAAIREKRVPIGDGRDGYEAMRMALAAYESERTGRFAKL